MLIFNLFIFPWLCNSGSYTYNQGRVWVTLYCAFVSELRQEAQISWFDSIFLCNRYMIIYANKGVNNEKPI